MCLGTGYQRQTRRRGQVAVYGVRGAVIEALNGMVREGAITGFQTLHFGKAETGEDPAVLVTVTGERDLASMRALAQRITSTLKPIAGDVIVTVRCNPPPQSTE
jgi:hypothetical protein